MTRRLIICCALLVFASSAEAQYRNAPPAGGEALYRWCNTMAYRKYVPRRRMETSNVLVGPSGKRFLEMVDACVRSHGQVY